MLKFIHPWIPLLTLAVGLHLSGCSLLPKRPTSQQTTSLPAPAPAPRTPTATHRFEIDEDTQLIGFVQRTVIGPEDTLSDIARRFDVGYEEVILANPGVDPWLPGVGREVIVPTQFILPAAPREGLVANLAAMRIFYYPPRKRGERQIVYTFPIGIGRVGWETREGTTKIIERTKNPVWVVPPSIRAERAKQGEKMPARVPPGPDNPLGQYRLRLSWSTYLIHGTNKPYGIGMRVSHGCMPMYPEDIAFLFDLVPINTKVTIVNQPYLSAWHEGAPYVQAYKVLEDDRRSEDERRKKLMQRLARPNAASTEIDGARIDTLLQAPRAVPMPVFSGPHTAGLDGAVLVENVLPEGSNWDGKPVLLSDDQKRNGSAGPALN